MPANPPAPHHDEPENADDFLFLSPEQYEVLRRAREEQQRDLSHEQVEALLKELDERT